MKKFIGYYIIGATSEYDAKLKKGLVLWTTRKPSAIHRFFNKVFLGIYWIAEVKELEEIGSVTKRSENGIETTMQRLTPIKKNSRKANKDV